MAIDLEKASYDECVQAVQEIQDAGRLDESLAGWETVRARFPEEPAGYAGAGEALRELGRWDEAEAILDEGMDVAPADERLAVAHAWVAHSRGDLPEADRRWNDVREAYPENFDGYFGGGDVLCSLGRFDEADTVYRTAFGLFPPAAHLLGDFAAVAEARGDAEEASNRWITLHTLFPDDVEGYVRQIRAYRDTDSPERAETVLAEVKRRFPGQESAIAGLMSDADIDATAEA